MFTESEARAIAADWHGGQGSALYAFSSSGHVDSSTELEFERVVSECEQRVANPAYARNLNSTPATELLEAARGALEYVKANTPTARAHALGVEAAQAAATWAADGNSEPAGVRRLLELIEAGDPQASDLLPPMPDLSGEWADGMTPGRLYEETTGRDAHGDSTWNHDAYQEVLEELCEAFETGVSETFEDACVAELRKWVDDSDAPHTGHYSRLSGTYWCDTCNSPYCDNA